jgi:hypothetical protein
VTELPPQAITKFPNVSQENVRCTCSLLSSVCRFAAAKRQIGAWTAADPTPLPVSYYCPSGHLRLGCGQMRRL